MKPGVNPSPSDSNLPELPESSHQRSRDSYERDMISFPILNKLEVSEFGLYPGEQGAPGLSVEFKPGLTLILGGNGLGKTTFVTILYRLLTGPYDIPVLSARTNLGMLVLKRFLLARMRERSSPDVLRMVRKLPMHV